MSICTVLYIQQLTAATPIDRGDVDQGVGIDHRQLLNWNASPVVNLPSSHVCDPTHQYPESFLHVFKDVRLEIRVVYLYEVESMPTPHLTSFEYRTPVDREFRRTTAIDVIPANVSECNRDDHEN